MSNGRQARQIRIIPHGPKQVHKHPIDTTEIAVDVSKMEGNPSDHKHLTLQAVSQPVIMPKGDPEIAQGNMKIDFNAPFSEALPYTRTNFLGILFSSLLLIGSLGYIASSVLLAFDKKGKEAYYANDPKTELTLRDVFENSPWTGRSLKTDYWGWFQRSHDKNSILHEYDVFYYVLIIGAGSGTICAIMSISEICKYNKDKIGRSTCVRA